MDEIFKVLKLNKMRFACQPCGSGKTENIKVIATVLQATQKKAKIVIALSTEFVQARILDDFKQNFIHVQ